ncbi:hypothetical protein PMI13_01222, partial [Chryseobacterium populi]
MKQIYIKSEDLPFFKQLINIKYSLID